GSESMTKGQLYDLANTQVGQRISTIAGVSRVQVYGSKSAIRIKADPSALASRQLTIEDLAAAIRQGTSYQGAGQFDGPNTTFLLQPQGQLDTAEQYNNLIVANRAGVPIYLKDVATARDALQDERTDMRFWVRGRHVPRATRVLSYSIDNLSLMALTLAIGSLVDDAIVFLENAVRRMEQYGETPMQAAINGAREISFTIISMTLSLAAVFLPLVFMSGLIGRV